MFRNQSNHATWRTKGISGHENLAYRPESLQNSKRHARGKSGQTGLPKRNVTTKALTSDEKCKASFTIYRDNMGFFFKGGQGPIQHSHHYKHSPDFQSVPSRFLDTKEQAILMSIANAHAGDGVCRNVCIERNSVFLNSTKIRHLHGIKGNKEMDESIDEGGNLRQQFKENGVSFCFLYHSLQQNKSVGGSNQSGTVVNETYIASENDSDTATISSDSIGNLDEPRDENQNMFQYALSHREKVANADSDYLWIALAYVTPQSRRLFRLYPHVIKFDVTMGTNEEKRPLLIVSGRTPWGENFIIMRVYLPNERAWVFRWVFQTAMPKLLGTEYLLLVKLALTDGDMQEFLQLDIAIKNYLKNAHRRRCSYHLINRGWIKNGPSGRGIVEHGKTTQWQALVDLILSWIYSWVTSASCPTKEHYQISKALLQQFLDSSKQLHDTVAPEVVQRVCTFLRENIEPNEQYYANYIFKNTLHFEEHSNSALEGLNSGMKRNSAPLRPNHSICKTTSVHLLQNNVKACQMAEKVNRDLVSRKLWSSLPTADGIEKKGETIIRQNWNRRVEYSCFRAGKFEWRVRKTTRQTRNKTVHPIPFYDSVHIVKIASSSTMLCSCGYFQECGLPCVHQMATASAMNPSFPGFKTSDVNVVWWTTYHNYGERPHAHPEITQYFQQLLKCGIEGPRIPWVPDNFFEDYPMLAAVPDDYEVKAPQDCCLNYTAAEIEDAIQKFEAFGVVSTRYKNNESGPENTNHFDGHNTSQNFGVEEPASAPSFVSQKEKPVYMDMMPLVKEWINLMEDFDDRGTYVDVIRDQMEEQIAKVKASILDETNRKYGSRKRDREMQSICVPTDKRQRLQISKRMLS